ncbi:MAG: hypothetical protein APR63_08395 [Desulfuromonas sp. SDB]|nr:MAG: hypothetical protein APR63_08395 [Desulfuromonas sp. SDB]
MILLLSLIIITLLFFIFLFTSSEIALIASRSSKIKSMKIVGRSLALKVLGNIETNLSVILVGTNICLVAISTISEKLSEKLINDHSSLLSTFIITLIILIFGEIIPKSISNRNPSLSLIRLSSFIYTSSIILKPLSLSMKYISASILNLVKISPRDEYFTSSDMENTLREGAGLGLLPPHAQKLADGIKILDQLKVDDIMQPRSNVTCSFKSEGLTGIKSAYQATRHKKIVLADQNIDDILGVVYIKDIVVNSSFNYRQPVFIYQHSSVKTVVNCFNENPHCDLLIVVDEFGQLAGIITKTDLINSLAGAVHIDQQHPQVIKSGPHGILEVRGDTKVEVIENLLKVSTGLDPKETIASCILDHCGLIPEEGNTYTLGKINVEITDSSSKNIKSVKISKIT